MSRGICEGRVVIITGAGRGIGRRPRRWSSPARAPRSWSTTSAPSSTARGGSDRPGRRGGRPRSGPRAARPSSTATTSPTGRAPGDLVNQPIETFGRLDVVVNNAGVVRDRMFANATEDEWDLMMRVHLKGHFATSRHAAAYWRDRSKAGEAVDARIINTTSGAGLMG